jgi:simple sugar transport system permease protein
MTTQLIPPVEDEDEAKLAQKSTVNQVLREIMGGGIVRTVLAILCGFIVGALLIAATSDDVARVSGYFFSRPMDTISAAWEAITDGYGALFRGSIYNANAKDFATAIRPITETLRLGAPLIASGLGIALSFRVGLFNIGGQGQLLMGVVFAGFASFAWPLPPVLHLIVAIVFGILGAALWGSIVGLLKATSGAHEVIVTIMLNYVAVNLVTWLMRSGVLHDPSAGSNPQSIAPLPTAQLPRLLGDGFAIHAGFLLVVAATVLYWWLMERSSIGFRFRAVGINPHAAKTAGMNVPKIYIIAMASSAAFVGIAGVNQVLGRTSGVTPSIDAGIGFDGITVALLGAGGAVGIFFAGLLFGAMKAGSPAMQIADVSPEVLLVVQGVIVLFIAAPPLVKAIFRLPKPVHDGPLSQAWHRMFRRDRTTSGAGK